MNQPAGTPRKSGGALKWILLGCGGIVLLGGAFFGVMGYLAYKMVSRDPVKVEADAQEILTFQKPEGFKGVFSMSMMGVKMATLMKGAGGQPDTSTIVLMQMPAGQVSADQLRAQMRANLEKQGQSSEIVEKRKNETFKVRGKDTDAQVEVTVHKGAEGRNLQYSLVLEGSTAGPVMLVLSGPEKQADHDWVQKFLDTVK